MPRKARRLIVVPDQPHHIVLRGNNRRRIFSYPREHRFFLDRLLRSSRRHRMPVHVDVQMGNHVHLVVTPSSQEQLSRFVGFVAQAYAQFRNRSRGSSGKLFEERYKCIPITGEEQMAVTTAYIALNPVRARLCTEAQDYRWSTFPLQAGTASSERLIDRLWTPSAWYLSLGAEPRTRASRFLDWFDHYRARDDWSEVYRCPAVQKNRRRFERPDRHTAI